MSSALRWTTLVHLIAVLSILVDPERWRAILSVLVANHTLLTAATMTPRNRVLGPNMTRLPSRCSRQVALTFDDGPEPEVTPKVLDLLTEVDARATFFAIGDRVANHPSLVAEILARGHRVENHTQSHPPTFAFWGPRRQGREIDRAQRVIGDVTGRAPALFRAPAGFANPFLAAVLGARSLSLVSWTRRGFDTVDRRPERVARRLLSGLAERDILVLHDTAANRVDGRPIVLEVLPRLLEEISRRDLACVAIERPSAD